MFQKRKGAELDPPPVASNTRSVELLRVWALPDGDQQLSLRTIWKDPAAWGLLLVDIARHASLAYEREGRSRAEVLTRIREGFDAEWSNPTDEPVDLTDDA